MKKYIGENEISGIYVFGCGDMDSNEKVINGIIERVSGPAEAAVAMHLSEMVNKKLEIIVQEPKLLQAEAEVLKSKGFQPSTESGYTIDFDKKENGTIVCIMNRANKEFLPSLLESNWNENLLPRLLFIGPSPWYFTDTCTTEKMDRFTKLVKPEYLNFKEGSLGYQCFHEAYIFKLLEKDVEQLFRA
uniref:SRR1-like domain-containing protein n=1 Tax=Panagrolaimus davidi TaxID=227884 RepID=A0A914QJ95_9BILA